MEELKNEQVNRLFKLCDLLKSHIITYLELKELKEIIGQDFENFMKVFDYKNFNDVYVAIDTYKSSKNIDRTKISSFISSICTIRYDFHQRFIEQNK
jgi:hypothetical protein